MGDLLLIPHGRGKGGGGGRVVGGGVGASQSGDAQEKTATATFCILHFADGPSGEGASCLTRLPGA